MKVIYKYQFKRFNEHLYTIEIPKNAKILDLQIQNGIPVIWALVHKYEETTSNQFLIYCTGEEIDDTIETEYIGTYQTRSNLVFHVFKVINN